MRCHCLNILLVVALLVVAVASLQRSWGLVPSLPITGRSSQFQSGLLLKAQNPGSDDQQADNTHDHDAHRVNRRQLFQTVASASSAAGLLLLPFYNDPAHAAVQRAVGGAEIDCRAAGNCLDIGQLDGAVGWTWGAKDRCDATDPRCGGDGQLGDLPQGKPVPTPVAKITHVAQIVIDVGREEVGVLNLGFYGEECPASVTQIMLFLSSGIATTSSLAFENRMGVKSSPVSLLQGGKIPNIVPNKVVDFGIPSQAQAYSRSRGLRSAGDDFLPQSRPNPNDVKDDPLLRKHDVAGLLSVPAKGIGYGGTGFESEDEAFESAFFITADAVPSMDKANRRVVGQVVDEPSMAFLARLASIPTKKGIKGVIPGQASGPPLLKVTVRDVEVKKV